MRTPSLTLEVLRPLAFIIATSISPWQTASILNEHGFEGSAATNGEAEALLVKAFEILDNEGKVDESKKIVEALLTHYGRLVPDKQNVTFQSKVNTILHEAHFSPAFDIS